MKLFVIASLLFIFLKSYGRQYSFKEIINKNKIGKAYVSATKNDTSWRTYLGIFIDKKRKSKYFVIKEFAKFHAASTWHGNSRVYFFKLNEELFATAFLGMPDDLPFKLFKNTFYFLSNNKGTKKIFKNHLNTILPVFCTGEADCFEIGFK